MLAGIALRGWSFKALGEYFTRTAMVSPDQPVVTAGPYRLLRHPSYAGVLLACTGIGLASANWVGLAGLALLPLALILWRIHIEENALLTTLGDRYRAYAGHHKRLVPSSGDPNSDRNRPGRGALIREVASEVHVPEPVVLVPSAASGRLRRLRGSGPR